MLSQGPLGTLYEALDEHRLDLPGSDRRIALKRLSAAVTQRPAALEELQRDFQYLQSLTHPGIVRVFDFDRAGDTTFYTMELLEGASSAACCGREPAFRSTARAPAPSSAPSERRWNTRMPAASCTAI